MHVTIATAGSQNHKAQKKEPCLAPLLQDLL